LKRSNETEESITELVTIKQNEREQQRACNDQPKPKRAAESLKLSTETKEGSKELEPIKRNKEGQQRA
jgi:hypothetical protein